MANDADLQPAVATEFLALAGLLDSASSAQWDTPSLCEGWRVREVVAHMTMPARYSEDDFMAKLRDCNFDFPTLSNQVAAQDAELPTAELVANLRDDGMHHWTPPGGGFPRALNHVVIHGLDVTVPLESERRVPEETIRVVLDGLTLGGGHANFGVDLDGRRLQATDLDWSYASEGRELRGSAEDLALTICGRTLPAGRVQGDPLSSTP